MGSSSALEACWRRCVTQLAAFTLLYFSSCVVLKVTATISLYIFIAWHVLEMLRAEKNTACQCSLNGRHDKPLPTPLQTLPDWGWSQLPALLPVSQCPISTHWRQQTNERTRTSPLRKAPALQRSLNNQRLC